MKVPTAEYYSCNGADEFCLVAGPDLPRKILLVPPLFEEANRLRRSLLLLMRALLAADIGSVLPDLPGRGESLFPQSDATLALWRNAVGSCAETFGISHIAAFRGGALIDSSEAKRHHWRAAPVSGANLLRTMMRTRLAAEKESGSTITLAELEAQAAQHVIELAGNHLSPDMVAQLRGAVPAPLPNCRTVRLTGDLGDADARIAGTPLWLRAEPGEDSELVSACAKDLVGWIGA
ncbi:MAG: hypothetical protein U5J78_03950 [Parasphingorhabdus sp.]|nr:hypothetical protein [Parasphingorhabdus sp.]